MSGLAKRQKPPHSKVPRFGFRVKRISLFWAKSAVVANHEDRPIIKYRRHFAGPRFRRVPPNPLTQNLLLPTNPCLQPNPAQAVELPLSFWTG